MHTTWEKAQVDDNVVVKIETDVNSKMIDPYCCKILTKNEKQRLVTVGHIPREISRFSARATHFNTISPIPHASRRIRSSSEINFLLLAIRDL